MQCDNEYSDAEDSVSKYFNNPSDSNNGEACNEGTSVFSSATTVASRACVNEEESSYPRKNSALSKEVREDGASDAMDDQTEEYSLNAEDETEWTHSPVEYTSADFESVDESDESLDAPNSCDSESDEEKRNDMGQFVSKRKNSGQEDMSDHTSDENMQRPWREENPKVKKYRQTRLNFGQGAGASAAAAASTSDSDSSSAGRRTRKGFGRNTGGSRESYFKRMGDRDTENYRLGYPGQRDDPKLEANLRFYKGEISSYPDGAFIDEIHNDWWGNFRLLERHHGYIQWIFPIREEGMNWQAQALQLHEAKEIISDKDAHNRVLLSYEMMLDFYGMRLEDRRTGKIRRSRLWEERYENLNFSSHNYLRITRILKSLGEFDLEHLKKPWLQFMLSEIFEHQELKRTLNSLQNYWIGTIKDDADREELYQYIEGQT